MNKETEMNKCWSITGSNIIMTAHEWTTWMVVFLMFKRTRLGDIFKIVANSFTSLLPRYGDWRNFLSNVVTSMVENGMRGFR